MVYILGRHPYELWLWLAGFRRFADWASGLGHEVTLRSTWPPRYRESAVHAAGLRLVSAHTGLTACPYRAAYDANPDIGTRAFAQSYIPTLRSWSETVFANALGSQRPANERAAIVDRFYRNYEDMVANDPNGHAMDYVHSYLAIEKV